MAPARRVNWSQVVAGMGVVAVLSGLGAWNLQMQTMDRQITQTRERLKKLHLGEHLPPSPEVVAYLKERSEALKAQYASALAGLATAPEAPAGQGDPQLLFQERSHDVQRTLERLATARSLTAPMQLGFPKDLPPPEAVPRFLVQVGLIEQADELLMGVPGIGPIESFKVDDPEPLPVGEESDVFLSILPVRVRLTCSLEVLTKILGAIDRAKPLMDLQGVRISKAKEDADGLSVELSLARYFVTAPGFPPLEEEPRGAPSSGRSKKSSS